jgi:Zn finger protein HypA/HybF involved in hydrogenase expression
VKFFQKEEPDLICWNCNYFFNHKKINWKPRQVAMKGDTPVGTVILTNQIREMEKALGNKEAIATPNKIFGASEYEYRGQCPKCHQIQTCFWFGEKSVNKNKTVKIEKKEIVCGNCKHIADRAFQVWYSIRMQKESKITEFLVTICPKCSAEQAYPYEYDLERGIIE